MIPWVRKNVTRRISFILLLAIVFLAVGAYYFWPGAETFPISYSFIALAVFFFIFTVFLYSFVNKPLKKLTQQMKYLLTGRSYKRITSNRIDEIGIIAQFFNEITENLESISKKLKEEKRMSSELEVASEIQRNIMPEKSPEVPGLEIVAKTRPAVEVGGDSFDFIQTKDSTFFYIGDVTGHGAPAALVMMMVNTLLNTYSEMYDSAYDIVVNTNKILKPRIKAAMFMTMVMLKWDHIKQKMSYVGAGHEYILVYRAKTGQIESQAAGGVALGMVPDNSKLVKEKELNLEEGDMVIVYTDGITEAKNDAGEMFGIERLIETIKKHAAQYGPEGVAHHTALDFSAYVGEAEQEDDITLMVLKYAGKDKKGQTEKEKVTSW